MRSAVLILVPLLLLASLFYFVVVRSRAPQSMEAIAAQSQATPTTRKVVPATIPAHDPSSSVVGASSNVWIETLNRKTGKLANKFRAARFDPRPDGDVDVTFPQAQFNGENGGLVTLEGSNGRVSLSQPGERSDPHAMGAASPTAGVLNNVVIRVYDNSAEGEPVGEPSMIAQVPAVHFDAIGNRIATVDSVIDGKGVLAEQVPVTVRGRDFEFDGYGLAMNWNARDGRLDSLEVNKGERLLIKDPERFGFPASNGAKSGETTSQPAAAMEVYPAFSPASLFIGAIAIEPAATKPSTKRQQLYHATFDHAVRIMRDGKQLAAGDVMRVVVPLGESRAAAPETLAKSPTRRPETQPASDAATRPTEATHIAHRPAAKRSTDAAATAPTTAPSSPIEVRWDGPLTVRPVEFVPDAPHVEMVELVGTPAWAEENGSRADARLIRAEPGTGRLRLEPGGGVRAIAVHDASGAELRSRSTLTVDRSAGVAGIEGGGLLVTPATATQPDATTVTWSRRLKLLLGEGETSWLKQVVIEGEANVANPQLKVTSDALTLGFAQPTKRDEAPATKPSNMAMPATDLSALRSVLATGDAKMEIGAVDVRRTLAASKIQLGLVAGKGADAALETVRCDDKVMLTDAKGFSLAASNLDVKLKPTSLSTAASPTTAPTADASPLADVDRLLATGAVIVKQADGSTALGERLEMTTDADVKRMTLAGAPARIASPRGGLEGERILLDPGTGDVNVPGPGKLTGTGDAGQPDAAMDIAWLESMKASNQNGTCDLLGGVRINGRNPNGTHLQASAQTGRILFVPHSAGATTKPTASPPTTKATAPVDAIRAITLNGDVDVAMQELDVRTSSVQTQQLDIDWENGTLTAPKPGRLLILDGRAATQPTTRSTTLPATEPATQPTMQTSQPSTRPFASTHPAGKSGIGSLAIAWQQQLFWNMRDGKMTFDGGVRLGFEKPGTNDPIRMTADRLLCELDPIQSGQGSDAMNQKVDLKTVTAEQNVRVRSRLASFDAAMLKFDAGTGRATATGDAETQVEVFDADATSRVGFSSITWNLNTGLIEDFHDINGTLRR